MVLPMTSVSKQSVALATLAAILKSGEGDYDNAPLGPWAVLRSICWVPDR